MTFLWEGADPGAGSAPSDPGGAPPAPTATPVPAAPAPQGALTVDNANGGLNEISGTWFNGSCGVGDSHRWTYTAPNQAKAENLGSWKAPISKPGFYEVFAYVPACGKPATRAAQYVIKHEGSTTTVSLDQEGHQNAWNSLGTFFFKPNAGQEVALGDLTGESGLSVRYDALAWVPRSDTEAPSATITNVRSAGAGKYEVTWSASDNGVGVASFDVQVQRNNGTWTDWLVQTPSLGGTYLVTDVTPAIYGFRVRARDWAGNIGTYTDGAQMTTANAQNNLIGASSDN